jgi:acetyl esterase/lipase
MLSFRGKFCRLLIKHLLAPKFHAKKTIDEKRKVLETISRFSMLSSKTKVERVQVNGISADWVSANDVSEDKIVLYFHGGGYNACSPNTHRELCANISIASCAKVLLIDYRLAPENPFPAALEDATSSYRWLLKNGYSNENIAVAGDSAGGGLSVAASISLRDGGEPMPSSVACISPWTDLELSGDSIKTHASIDPMLTLEVLQHMASNYIKKNNPCSPYISPIYADLKGLPPLFIQVGSDEMLLDDSIRIVEKAKNSGVDVKLEIYDQMWHVWHLAARFMPEAKKAVNELGLFIRNHFTG